MQKVILTKGLPGSGKSTWAKEMLAQHPNQYKRVNKDELRAMLDNGYFNGRKTEDYVLAVRDQIILSALAEGRHVIVDDTNLDPKHEKHVRELVQGKALVEIKDFTHVTLAECLERDQKRQNYVGEQVIRSMHKRYLAQERPRVSYNPALPDCYIFDVDGTLAIRKDRGPFEWEKVGRDVPNIPIIRIWKRLIGVRNINMFVVSGRDEICRQMTIDWLANQCEVFPESLYMRPQGDTRQDAIIKEEIYRKHIEGKYNVLAVFDDRNQTVAKWRELGLTCLQVADGDF